MTTKLFFQAMAKYLLGVALLGALLFAPAGTLHYWQAWLFLGLLFVPMFFAGVVMMVKSPELLQKRLNAKEEEKEQKAVVALSGVMFLAAFIAAGLNARFDWLHFPLWAVWTASGVFLLAYLMYAEVMRENAYLSRTIEVQESQTVVDSGLYGIIRHPMYAATLFLFLSMGIILDSPLSLAITLFYIPIIAARMKNEEKVLEEGLNGYREYKTKVKYKVIPFVW